MNKLSPRERRRRRDNLLGALLFMSTPLLFWFFWHMVAFITEVF